MRANGSHECPSSPDILAMNTIIDGWEAGKSLSEAARQKVVETERLRAALAELVPANELGEWMRESNPAFEGQTPIQVIERGEADRIWRMIFQIEASVAN